MRVLAYLRTPCGIGQRFVAYYNRAGLETLDNPLTPATPMMPKKLPPSLTALGTKLLPHEIEVAGHRYAQQRIFKNDFFAVTALYEGDAGKVILKVHRQASFLLLPLRWLGRWLVRREAAAFDRLHGVDGVPDMVGRFGETGLVRNYIEGHPLMRGERVADDFHVRLRSLIDSIHARGMAYVDLEKSENVLVGDDGRPHLFDFQIAWFLRPHWGGELWPARKVRKWLQAGDLYHLGKLHRRTRPDQFTPQELTDTYRRPWYVRAHRFATWPFTWFRRQILDRLDPRRTVGERGRVS